MYRTLSIGICVLQCQLLFGFHFVVGLRDFFLNYIPAIENRGHSKTSTGRLKKKQFRIVIECKLLFFHTSLELVLSDMART